MGEPEFYDNGTPVFKDYRLPPRLKPEPPGEQKLRVSWLHFVERWELTQCDLMSLYQVRDDRAADYQWPFFRTLVFSLASNPKALMYHALREHLQAATSGP